MVRIGTGRRMVLAVAAGAVGIVIGAAGAGAAVLNSDGQLRAIETATETSGFIQILNDWVNVPGMVVNVTVPSAQTGLFVVTFSATGRCTNLAAFENVCRVRLMVDGLEAPPGDVVWASSTDDGGLADATEPGSMQWVQGGLDPGQHVVRVQARAGLGVRFDLFERTLTVIRAID